jgi:hypothetical protein
MPAPRTVDNVTLTERTDFADLVRNSLLGGVLGALRGDCYPLDAVERVHHELTGSPYAGRWEHGVAACLTDPDPFVRAQALLFFQAHPHAGGAGRVRELLAGDRDLFRGVPDPLSPGSDLEARLLATFAHRVSPDDPPAVALACAEVVVPGRAAPLIGALADAAPEWVVAHAETIVAGTPSAGATLLIRLQAVVSDLVGLGRRVVPLCRGDTRFESDIARFIDDHAAGQEILDLFRAAGT